MTSPGTNADGLAGQQQLGDDTSDFNKHVFLIKQVLGLVSTATIVKVVAVSNEGGVAAVGTVDVLPLVNMIDGAGNASSHATVYGLPYFRVQGGAAAVILDPKVGDLGIAIFADRDVSAVKATKDQANPGSRRRFDMADGLYVGGVLNGVPAQYLRFSGDDEVELVSMVKVKIKAPSIVLDGAVEVTGDVTGAGGDPINIASVLNSTKDITTTATITGAAVVGGGKNLATHVHGGVQTGGGNTGPPV